MNLKKEVMFSIIGAMALYGYMKYRDGSIERAIKNMKPMMEMKLDDLKNSLKAIF